LAAEYTKIFVDNKKTMLIIYSVLIIQGMNNNQFSVYDEFI